MVGGPRRVAAHYRCPQQRARGSHCEAPVDAHKRRINLRRRVSYLRHTATANDRIRFNSSLPAPSRFPKVGGWEIESRKRSILKSIEAKDKPVKEIILDYDYTFMTPYCGSETVETTAEGVRETSDGSCSVQWEDCKEKIDVILLASNVPILFYDEIILYEDELADNGVSLLTV
uniref:Uncharacterized protein n=1 Tax=Kalanchoe fedtschenkoi TaxID=63787 RepID=A0A7N0TS28_KALFE